jgi:hypothetical protein
MDWTWDRRVVEYIVVEVQEQEQAQVYTVVVQEQVQELGMVVELAQDMVEEQVQVFATERSEIYDHLSLLNFVLMFTRRL